MKKKLIIFGVGDIAELANFYFSNDSDYEVVAFTVDQEYIESDIFCDLPVIPFEKVDELYSPSEYFMFIAVSYSKLNQVRKDKYTAAKEKGYKMASYISSQASILNEGAIGDNCFILEDNTVQPFVTIGNNVTLWSGNHIGHHSTIHDHAFISSHVVVSGGVSIGSQSFIGVNATLRDHIVIGEKCVIGAGVIMLSSAEREGVYIAKESPRSRIPSPRLPKI